MERTSGCAGTLATTLEVGPSVARVLSSRPSYPMNAPELPHARYMSGHDKSPGEEGPGRREFALAPPPIPFVVTPRAREALVEVLRIRPRGCVVHLTMVLGEHPHPRLSFQPATRGEVVFEQGGIPFVIDPPSRRFLSGATIDHVVEDGFASFEIEGPNLRPGPD